MSEVACDAGAICADGDGDGFAACGCSWSGTPCDCDDADPATYPGAPERCDATKDFDCSGVAPDRCPDKKACLDGVCVPECVPLADFGCPAGAAMSGSFASGDAGTCLCVPQDCTVFGCPEGESCSEAKTCVPTCGPGVRCPAGQICRGTGCVDPCAEVRCPDGVACVSGRCVASCACPAAASCEDGRACDLAAPVPTCIDAACLGVSCPGGARCEGGVCVDDCQGVVCPPRRVCAKVSVNGGPGRGKCVDLCSPNPCAPGWSCDWNTAACSPPPPDGRSIEGPTHAATELVEVAGAGWSCEVGALGRAPIVGALACSIALTVLALRRWRG